MKKHILSSPAIFLFSFIPENSGITQQEREKAIAHLTKTKAHMTKVLDGLTAEQLNFKPTAASWSITECAEHLAFSENAFNGLIQKTIADGNDPKMKDTIQMTDEQLLNAIKDRSHKVTTPEPFEPTGKFGNHAAKVSAFAEKRAEHIAYIETTKDDLRNRFNADLPFGTIDAYQLMLFTAGHTERHVLQMEEVMQHKDFPKK